MPTPNRPDPPRRDYDLINALRKRCMELDPRQNFILDDPFIWRALYMGHRKIYPGCKAPFTLLIVLDLPDGGADVSFFEAGCTPGLALRSVLKLAGKL